MRWKAPIDTTSVHVSSGPIAVKDGFATTADDLSIGDRAGLAANGFVLDNGDAPAPSPEAAALPAPDHAREPIVNHEVEPEHVADAEPEHVPEPDPRPDRCRFPT